MGKIVLCVGISFTICSLLLDARFQVIRALLFAVGVVSILIFGLYASIKRNKLVCPGCNTEFTWTFPIAYKQRDGIYSCPRCGTLIRVAKK